MRGATKHMFPHHGASHISIHAPREGSDLSYSTWDVGVLISIHAPREGSDC